MCKMMTEKPNRRKTEGWYRECWVSLDRGYLNINERRRGGSFSSPAATPIQRSRSAYDRFRTSDDDTAARGSFQVWIKNKDSTLYNLLIECSLIEVIQGDAHGLFTCNTSRTKLVS